MTQHPPRESQRIEDQVAAAEQAIARDASDRARMAPLAGPSPTRWLLAAASLAGLALSLWINREGLQGGVPDLDVEVDGTVQTIEYTRRVVEAHWDSAGVLPASLVDVGLGELPLVYTPAADSYRIAALVATGDSVGYQSPPLSRRTGGAP